MAAHQRSTSAAGTREKTYFEQQREALVGEIAMSFEHVLANVNKLNRSLEAVIAVGNEFSSVEALWSQFESVMAKEPEEGGGSSNDNNHTDKGGDDNDDGGLDKKEISKGQPDRAEKGEGEEAER